MFTNYAFSFQKVGDNNVEGKDNFFQATTLASYITLNDNLRLFEEQHRKKITYTFGTSGWFSFLNLVLLSLSV